jgi:hypothetical protein
MIPESPSMYVLILVTAAASSVEADLIFYRYTMAGETFHPFMFPIEDILSLAIVVELPELPSIGIMTISAIGAETFFVLIIRLVAAHTVQPGILVGVVQVALFTGCYGVQADQGE